MIVHDVDKSVLFSSGLITQERYEELLEFCKKNCLPENADIQLEEKHTAIFQAIHETIRYDMGRYLHFRSGVVETPFQRFCQALSEVTPENKGYDMFFSGSATRSFEGSPRIYNENCIENVDTFPYFIEIDIMADSLYTMKTILGNKENCTDISPDLEDKVGKYYKRVEGAEIGAVPNLWNYYRETNALIANGKFLVPDYFRFDDSTKKGHDLKTKLILGELQKNILLGRKFSPWYVGDSDFLEDRLYSEKYSLSRVISFLPGSEKRKSRKKETITICDIYFLESTIGPNAAISIHNIISGIEAPHLKHGAVIALSEKLSRMQNRFGRSYVLKSIRNWVTANYINNEDVLIEMLVAWLDKYIDNSKYRYYSNLFWFLLNDLCSDMKDLQNIKCVFDHLEKHIIHRTKCLNFSMLQISPVIPFATNKSELTKILEVTESVKRVAMLRAYIIKCLVLCKSGTSEMLDIIPKKMDTRPPELVKIQLCSNSPDEEDDLPDFKMKYFKMIYPDKNGDICAVKGRYVTCSALRQGKIRFFSPHARIQSKKAKKTMRNRVTPEQFIRLLEMRDWRRLNIVSTIEHTETSSIVPPAKSD